MASPCTKNRVFISTSVPTYMYSTLQFSGYYIDPPRASAQALQICISIDNDKAAKKTSRRLNAVVSSRLLKFSAAVCGNLFSSVPTYAHNSYLVLFS
jgi:hypothetical protein